MRSSTRAVSRTAGGKEFEDILFCTIGVVLLLLVVALAQVGVPDVSQSTLETLKSGLNEARQAQAVAQEALEGEKGKREAADRRAAEEQRRRKQSEEERVKAEEKRRQSEAAVQAARDKVKAAEKKAKDAEARAKQAKSDLDPKPVDVVLVCDGTLSMGPVLLALQKAVLSLSEIGSRLSPRFRLGIIIYRSRGYGEVFPLSEIKRSVDGRQSAGMVTLRSFMEKKDMRVGISNFDEGSERGRSTGKFNMVSRMTALSGDAYVEGGVRDGLAMLKGSKKGSRTVLLLVGDVGTHEGGDPKLIETGDQSSAERIRQMVKSFVGASKQARVWSVFAGKELKHLKHRTATIEFFQSVAGAAGEQGKYSDELSHLVAATVEAVFGSGSK